MKAEILTIGDELCRGEIVDTNSAWLAERLTDLGFHVRGPILLDHLAEEGQSVGDLLLHGGLVDLR